MANKNCLIYETLNGVSDMQKVKKENGMMTLTGVFGVCGVRNNNKRVYETSNYAKMVQEMKSEIAKNNGIPGELEHPQTMNITLENISHKITDINIDENGLVTGSITLLNTPKGKIAQAIVEGGLPLFISSRATGQVDASSGNVTLERIATYDLVGSPGFSQARLKLNENQIAESICESVYYVTDKNDINENNTIDDMEMKELLERFEALEQEVAELKEQNEELQMQVESANSLDVKRLADSIQKWIIEEYSPAIQDWIMEEFAPEHEETIAENIKDEIIEESVEASKDMFVNEMADKIQEWVVEEFAPEVQNWVVEEFAPEVQNWCVESFAPGIQNWIINEYAPETEKWMNESFMSNIKDVISESINESKKNSLSSIDETLRVLESIEVTKPTYSRKAIITENAADEPFFVREMPATARVKWEMASEGVKESITRRAKLYDFTNEGAVERFWSNIDFAEVKPVNNVYEGLETIVDERERGIRQQLRSWRAKRQ
jgi:uncharacterized protein (UPF0335 family)